MRQKRLGGSPKVGAYVWKLGVVCAMPPARLTSGGLLGQGEALRYLSQVRLRRAQNIVQLCVGIGPGVPKVKEQSWTAKGNRTIETSGFPASWMARRALRRPCSIGHDSPSYHGPESLNPAQEEAARKVPLGCVRREAESTQGCLAVQVSHEVSRERVLSGEGKREKVVRRGMSAIREERSRLERMWFLSPAPGCGRCAGTWPPANLAGSSPPPRCTAGCTRAT